MANLGATVWRKSMRSEFCSRACARRVAWMELTTGSLVTLTPPANPFG